MVATLESSIAVSLLLSVFYLFLRRSCEMPKCSRIWTLDFKMPFGFTITGSIAATTLLLVNKS